MLDNLDLTLYWPQLFELIMFLLKQPVRMSGYNQIVRELIQEKKLVITETPIVEHFLDRHL